MGFVKQGQGHTAAKAVHQRDLETLASWGIEHALLKITHQVVNEHLMLCQAVLVKYGGALLQS